MRYLIKHRDTGTFVRKTGTSGGSRYTFGSIGDATIFNTIQSASGSRQSLNYSCRNGRRKMSASFILVPVEIVAVERSRYATASHDLTLIVPNAEAASVTISM